LSIAFFTRCVSSKVNFKNEFKIIEVSSQKYRGGLKGTPNGIKYKILFVAPASNIDFNTIGFWIDNKFAPAVAFKNKIGVNKTQFKEGDTLTVLANFIKIGDVYAYQDADIKLNRPKEYSNKVLLGYKLNNRQQYIGHDKITELEEELRP